MRQSEATKKRRQGGIRVSAVLRAKSRRVAGDLSSWRGERRGACMVVDHGSLTPEELHSTLFWPSPLSSKSLLEQTPPFSINLDPSPSISVFPSLSFVQVERFFYWRYLYLMILRFFSSVSFIGWEVFYRLIPYPIFLLSLSIIGLGGFSPATWPFETYQLPYGARIFSVVSRFSSPVSLIRLGGFSPGFSFDNSTLNEARVRRRRQL